MMVARVPNARGAVKVESTTRPRERPRRGEHMFCGVHVTRPSVMARLPEGVSDSLRQGYLPWLRAGERLAAYEHEHGYFAEHSRRRYLESAGRCCGQRCAIHRPDEWIDPRRGRSSAKIVSPSGARRRRGCTPSGRCGGGRGREGSGML
jgi:NDP-sugar pyrophosphorylase family protein